MDCCLLCLEFNKELLNFIEANSKRWQELNITTVLEKHFWPLNTMHPNSWMCLSCWQKLDDFNKFYLSIEEAHFNLGEIKIEENQLMYKEEITNQENENFSYCCLGPEILMEQNELGVLRDDKESSPNRKKKRQGLDENSILKKDPLAKTKVTKPEIVKKLKTITSTETITPGENEEDLKIKSEPADISNNNYSDSMNDDDEDNDDGPCTNSSESGKNKTINKKDNDIFLAEHFKQMSCDLCNVKLENFPAMRKHFTKMHHQKGYLVCCNRKFYQRIRLVDHLQIHLNPDYFKCTQCSKVLSDRRNFKSHMLRVHRPNNVVLKHSCDICGKSFTQGNVLRTHKLTHLPKEEKKFPCTECGKFYGSSYLLKIHTEVVHLKKQAKVCYICGKTLGTSTEYKAHMNKHEGILAPVINCDVCGLRLTSERSVKLHKESQHPVGGKQQHPCPVCHKISPTARALKKHVNTMHEKGYDHKCNMCEKAFRRAETLKEHIASQHTGTILYTCPWCPRTFNSNGNMHAHRKNVHPKEWEEAKLQKYSGNLPVELRATIANNNIEGN